MTTTRSSALWLLTGLFALAALVAAACGSDNDDDDTDPTTAATTTPTSDPERTATPTATSTTPPAITPAPPGTPPSEPGGGADPTAKAAGEAARSELARWLGPAGNLDATSVVSVEPVTWSNGCLDLARAGQACTEALVDGYRVTLALGSATYEVRTDAAAGVVLWAPETMALVRFVEASANSVVFETDDGNSLETQPVAGTSFGVAPSALDEGDPVGIGIARAPQRDGFLLVWLDPVPE